jgi:hypothetical protein
MFADRPADSQAEVDPKLMRLKQVVHVKPVHPVVVYTTYEVCSDISRTVRTNTRTR